MSTAYFSSEARLLEELGERLVTKPDVATLELIKNSYDSDAPWCHVSFDRKKGEYVFEDSGTGMSEEDFLQRWMKIATSSKSDVRSTPVFGRVVTGSKGIGRFAVRFLGRRLKLISVKKLRDGTYSKLVADFDWNQFNNAKDLSEVPIPYSVVQIPPPEHTGTRLEISDVNFEPYELEGGKGLWTELLDLINPFDGLESPPIDWGLATGVSDAFKVTFSGFRDDADEPDDEENYPDQSSLANELLQNFRGRVRLKLSNEDLEIRVYLTGSSEPDYVLKDHFPNALAPGVFADIRFFPSRAGVFEGLKVDGRRAKSWLKSSNGVRVFDRGFRMKPYGNQDDDWLRLGYSDAVSQRDWDSSIAKKHFPIPAEIAGLPKLNWALNLAKNHQLVGVVHVQSAKTVPGQDVPRTVPATGQGRRIRRHRTQLRPRQRPLAEVGPQGIRGHRQDRRADRHRDQRGLLVPLLAIPALE